MSISTPQEQPTPGQDPQSQQTPAATPAPLGDGPWTTDINLLFDDPAARTKVDSFLRQKVQPYTTQLEQQAASAREAVRLVENLNADPVDTYVAITTEMWGEEAGQAVLAQLQQQLDGQPPAQQAPATPATPPADPRLAAVIEYVESQQNNAYYENEVARVAREHPEIDADLFHPFVAAANGDFDSAVAIYNTWLADYGTKYNLDPSAAQPVAPAAPAVLGSDTQTAQASATPVAPRKQTLDEALDDFMAEQRASRQAPPVGSA